MVLTRRNARNLRLMHVLERIAARFNKANVPVMALKGAALYLTVYDRPDERPMSDLDLMIHAEDVDRAFALLEELGGLRGEPQVREDFFPRYYYEIEYTLGTVSPARIDLHVRPFRPLRYAQLVPHDALWDRAQSVAIGRTNVLVPSAEGMLIHLTVHAAIHGCTQPKWLVDIKRWTDAHERSIDWDFFVATVQRWNLALPVREALRATEHALGTVCPPTVSERLRRTPASWRDRLALRQAPRDSAHPVAHVATNILCTPGWRFMLGYIRAMLMPDKAHMANWYVRRHWGWLPCAHALRWLGPVGARLPFWQRWLSKTELRPSAIHGIGVFATRDVACGQVVARFHGKKVDRDGLYVGWRLDKSGTRQRYEITGQLRHLNHSWRPNARLSDFALVAQRNICAGEEITIKYEGVACTRQEQPEGVVSSQSKHVVRPGRRIGGDMTPRTHDTDRHGCVCNE